MFEDIEMKDRACRCMLLEDRRVRKVESLVVRNVAESGQRDTSGKISEKELKVYD